jgi:arginase
MKSITIIGAPSSIGIRPYADGTPRRLDLAPAALREQGVVARLGARDDGDVVPPPYAELTRPEKRPRNERDVGSYSLALAHRVADAADDGSFVLVLGGDCSILLGCLLGARAHNDRVGLVYLDAHSDFATPEESSTGSVAAMCLALAVGRGDSPLARLSAAGPLVRGEDVVLIGRRDEAKAGIYGQDALSPLGVLDLPQTVVRERGPAGTATAALDRLAQSGAQRFWIHVDADVLDPSAMPAVDSPEPNGMSLDDLTQLVRPLVAHPGAIGFELTIYDPNLDPNRAGAAALASVLEDTFAARRSA